MEYHLSALSKEVSYVLQLGVESGEKLSSALNSKDSCQSRSAKLKATHLLPDGRLEEVNTKIRKLDKSKSSTRLVVKNVQYNLHGLCKT